MVHRKLTEDLQKKAITELNEIPDRIQDDLMHLKEWAKKQTHLNIRTDDQWLISFMRGCKFSLERAKEKLALLCTTKTSIPEFFYNRNPYSPEIQGLLKQGIFLPISTICSPTSPRVILLRVDITNISKKRVEDCAKLITMVTDILLNEDDNFVVSGCQILIDDSGVSVDHFIQFTPTLIKKAKTCFESAYPVRIEGIHVINAPAFAVKAFDMFKQLLGAKIVKKIHIHGDSDNEDLYNSVPLEVLPPEYGGNGKTISQLIEIWKIKVQNYAEWFEEDAIYCSDRTTCLDVENSELGIGGSFRKLNID